MMEVRMKRIFGTILGICMVTVMAMGSFSMPARAATGSVSLSVSSSTVNIGDTITVTVSGSADVTALIQVNVSCSGGAEYTGSGNSAAILEPSAGGSDSASLTYRATSPGTVTFSASVVEAYAVETAEGMSIGGASASVTVNNAASGDGGGGNNGGGDNGGGGGGGNNGGADNSGDSNAGKSADNSLKSLTISPGTLSPAFKYSTTKYTASVGADVTSIAVDAQVSNAKASVESVTGNTDLKPGENTVKIVVKAENGTIAVYTITVNRGGAATEDPEEVPGEEDPGETPGTGIQIGGKSYKVSAAFPEDMTLPEEFEKSQAAYDGEEVEIYQFSHGNLKLYYLQEEVPEGTEGGSEGCYFYNEGTNTFFPYINIPVGSNYAIVLPLAYNTETAVPEGYEAAEVAFGEYAMDGFRLADIYTEGIEGAGDFYLVYGVSSSGTYGWYQFDSVEGSLQRFVQIGVVGQPEEEEPAFDEERYQKDYQTLQEKYRKEKDRAHLMTCVAVLVAVAAVIAIVNILVFGRRGGSRKKKDEDKDIDFIDFDDL